MKGEMMNKKIKYRVWDNENKSYDDPYSSAYYAMTQDGGLDFYCHGDHMGEADPDVYSIEQYTGLKDKHGKEIYEGDIVERRKLISAREMAVPGWGKDHTEIRRAVIVYKHGMFYGRSITAGINTNYSCDELEADFEIIGNIHENRDLLGDTNVTNKEEK